MCSESAVSQSVDDVKLHWRSRMAQSMLVEGLRWGPIGVFHHVPTWPVEPAKGEVSPSVNTLRSYMRPSNDVPLICCVMAEGGRRKR